MVTLLSRVRVVRVTLPARSELLVEPDLVHLDGCSAGGTFRAHRVEGFVSAAHVFFSVEEGHAQAEALLAVKEDEYALCSFQPGRSRLVLDPFDGLLGAGVVAPLKARNAYEHRSLLPSVDGRPTLLLHAPAALLFESVLTVSVEDVGSPYKKDRAARLPHRARAVRLGFTRLPESLGESPLVLVHEDGSELGEFGRRILKRREHQRAFRDGEGEQLDVVGDGALGRSGS